MRLISVVVVALAASHVLCQDLTQKVTYSSLAAPLSRIVGELAEQTKAKLDVAQAVRREIVVVDAKDVTLDDLLKRIASATGCEWQKDAEGTLRLVRTAEAARVEAAKERDVKIAALQKAIAKLTEPLKKNPAFTAKVADQILATQQTPSDRMNSGGIAGLVQGIKSLYTMGSDQPAGRAAARLLALVDPGLLADMEEGDRVVFSSRPTAMQRPMGGQAIQIIQKMVAEQAIWSEAYRRRHTDQNGEDVDQALGSITGVAYKPIAGKPDKALLCIERQPMLQSIDLRLKLFDAEGKLLFAGGQSVVLDSSPLNRIDDILKPKAASADPDIELSADSKELLTYFRGLAGIVLGGGSTKGLSKELLEKLRNPERYDPLSFIHSEAFVAAARSQNVSLVAVVPDSLMSMNEFAVPGQKLTVSGFLKALDSGAVMSVEVKGGWMIGRPATPVEARRRRTDREALGRLVRTAQAEGALSLDALSTYAVNNPPFSSSEVAQLYSVLMIPGAATNMMGGNDWDMLRLYGTLTGPQREALRNKQAIPFRGMIGTQAATLRQMIYGSGANSLQVKIEGRGPAAGNIAAVPDNEPTELLPNGIPPSGMLTLDMSSTQVVKDAGQNQPSIQLFSTFEPEELGAMMAVKDSPGIGAMLGSFLPSFESFRVGTGTTYKFLFQFTPAVSVTKTLKDASFDKNAPTVKFADLPEAFRKKVAEVQEAIKKGGGLPDIFGGGPAKP